MLPYQVFDRPKAMTQVQEAAAVYARLPEFWAGVHGFLGRRPDTGDMISTERFLPEISQGLPSALRLFVTPDPPVIDGAPVAYIFHRESDLERKVLIYFVHFRFS